MHTLFKPIPASSLCCHCRLKAVKLNVSVITRISLLIIRRMDSRLHYTTYLDLHHYYSHFLAKPPSHHRYLCSLDIYPNQFLKLTKTKVKSKRQNFSWSGSLVINKPYSPLSVSELVLLVACAPVSWSAITRCFNSVCSSLHQSHLAVSGLSSAWCKTVPT